MLFYDAEQAVLTSGTATTETAVSLVPAIPETALSVLMHIDAASNSSLTIRLEPAVTHLSFIGTFGIFTEVILPNVNQSVRYFRGAAHATNFRVAGYALPNGGD